MLCQISIKYWFDSKNLIEDENMKTKNKKNFEKSHILNFKCTLFMGECIKNPRKWGENVKLEIDIINQFDSCVKNALNKELKYRLRTIKNLQKNYVNISELSCTEQEKLNYNDEYPSDAFGAKLTTRLFEAVVHDELLYEALLSIRPKTRELILLKFWGELTDVEIGRVMNMKRDNVTKTKIRALKRLKEFMEGMNNYEK